MSAGISLILPYYERQKATNESMLLLAEHYHDKALEIVVVDDGSPVQFYASPALPLDVKVVRLPTKEFPLNPSVPYNRGVAESKGEYIALSNPEILHRKPVLERMLAKALEEGENAYVMAACWCEEQKRWHAHSTKSRSDSIDVGSYVPKGADYHFMTLMHKSLWNKTGGFDEEYRAGAGYDDPDFVRRLDRAGAKFFVCDDLVVEHPRRGARADWTAEMFARNRALFLSKWKPI